MIRKSPDEEIQELIDSGELTEEQVFGKPSSKDKDDEERE